MKTYYVTYAQMRSEIAKMLLDKMPYGVRQDYVERIREATSGERGDNYLSIEVDRSFTVNGRLDINLGYGDFVKTSAGNGFWTYNGSNELHQPEGTMMRVYHPSVTLGWSSTSRDVSNALAAIDVYTELTKLAALAETMLNRCAIAEVFRTVEQQAQDEEDRKARQAQEAAERAAKEEREAKRAARKAAKENVGK